MIFILLTFSLLSQVLMVPLYLRSGQPCEGCSQPGFQDGYGRYIIFVQTFTLVPWYFHSHHVNLVICLPIDLSSDFCRMSLTHHYSQLPPRNTELKFYSGLYKYIILWGVNQGWQTIGVKSFFLYTI